MSDHRSVLSSYVNLLSLCLMRTRSQQFIVRSQNGTMHIKSGRGKDRWGPRRKCRNPSKSLGTLKHLPRSQGSCRLVAASPTREANRFTAVCKLLQASPFYTGKLCVALTFYLFHVFKKLFFEGKAIIETN